MPAPGFDDNCGIDRADLDPCWHLAQVAADFNQGECNAQDVEFDCTLRQPRRGLDRTGRHHDRIRDVAQWTRLLDRHPVRARHPGGHGIQERGQRREDQADPARRRLRSLGRDPQRAQAHRGRKGRSPDRHCYCSVDHRHDGGRERIEGADDRGLPGHRTAESGRSMGHLRSATRLAAGQGGRRPHEARCHEEHRLYRLLRRLGRSGLQRRQGCRSRRRHHASAGLRGGGRRNSAILLS